MTRARTDEGLTLALDLGTSYLKAVAFDASEAIVAIARVPMTYDRPGADRFEMPLERFHAMIPAALDQLDLDRRRIARIAFSTQANTFACFDTHDRPLTPLIFWHDRRADAGLLSPLSSLPEFSRRTGLPGVFPLIMPAKARWLQQTRPECWSRARRVRFIGDELAHWLTGRNVTEPGYAALSGLLDIHDAAWWPQACAAVGLEPSMLGEPVRAGTDLGPLNADAATTLGLPRDVHVHMGCLDQYTGAIGTANADRVGPQPGHVSTTLGTVLATVRCTRSPVAGEGVFTGPAWRDGLYFQMVFGSTSANLLEHYRDTLPDRPDFGELDLLASLAEVPEDLVIAAAEGDAPIEQSFAAVQPHHTRGQVTRAILERVARSLEEQVQRLCGDAPPPTLHLAGGGARSELWRSILTRRVGPVTTAPTPEPTALGAARLIALQPT